MNNNSFAPSDAYVIIGHGFDSTNTFIVPKDCIVVVKARPGESMHYDSTFNYVNKVLDPKNIDTFKDPLNHISNVIEELGDVMIYKPGDRCPNYKYYLFSENDIFTFRSTGNHLGIIKAPKNVTIDTIDIDKNSNLTQVIKNIYKYSGFPKPSRIIQSLHDDFEEYIEETSTIDDIANIISQRVDDASSISEIEKLLLTEERCIITQKTMCRIPGVYYNFVCRAIPGVQFENRNEGNIINIKNVKSLKNTQLSPNNIYALKKRIGEAETKRKQLLRNTKYNRPSKGGKRKTLRKKKRL